MTALKNKGFTLIELLIVIAILGVLAVVVLVAINPAQQLARTRDAGRKSSVAQLGHAAEAFATTHAGTYPVEDTSWVTEMVDAGEISSVPGAITVAGFSSCAGTAENGWCYDAGTVGGAAAVIVYTKLESQSETSKCATPATETPWFVFSSVLGRGGVMCTAGGDPAVGTFVATYNGWRG